MLRGGTAVGIPAAITSGSITGVTFDATDVYGTQDSITAFAGGGKASATVLTATKSYHRVSVCATAADSVLLPASVAGVLRYVRNDGAAAMQVFGAGTDTINGVATGTGVSQAAGTGVVYVCTTAGNWTTTSLIDPTGTVSSVAVSGGTTGLTTSGGPITSSGTITLAGTLAPQNGGTGVANNSASTLTISGNFGTTLTVGATTALTLPSSGTVATLAGSEAFTNKTYNGNTLTAGTYTITGTAAKTLTFSNSITLAGTDSTTMTFPPVSASIGYLNVPSNSQSADYGIVLGDSGYSIDHPSTDTNARTFTIPANGTVAFPVGTCLTFSNMTANVVTIAITTDTMYLAGAGTTGSRSLAQYGVATARKLTSTTWLISGTGLT